MHVDAGLRCLIYYGKKSLSCIGYFIANFSSKIARLPMRKINNETSSFLSIYALHRASNHRTLP